MKILPLDGAWTLRKSSDSRDIPATVPGCVHLDLLRAGLIEDPFLRDNEAACAWVSDSDWALARSFEVDAALLALPHVVLRCEGLDTFATVLLNGVELGRADNMFRTWEFDVKTRLRPGANSIEVRFDSPTPLMTRRQEEHFLWHTGIGHHRISGGNWVRKEQCQFGWDWGPMLPTMGIWRSISLVAFEARVAGVAIAQKHRGGAVELGLRPELEGNLEGTSLDVGLSLRGATVDHSEGPPGNVLRLRVERPELWWPNGMGAQPLYELRVTLRDASGRVLDSLLRRVGLRTLELVRERDAWGESFCFAANGRRFFAKGANWIPADAFDARIENAGLRDLLESARDAHMNMVRVWGGGKYERDAFYDLCDELGLCVWQDFMFACSAYPAHEADFVDSVRQELRDNVRRLRHHACLALWCGNNELEQIPGCVGGQPGAMDWADYCALFDHLLPGVVAELDPGRPYWPSSCHNPIGDRSSAFVNDPRWGDAHLWKVWHGREPFEWYRSSFHRFCSEFGFQSFPEPRSVAAFTIPGDRNIASHVMELHQRSPIGNSAIMDYALSWFRLPVGFDNTLWLSQIVQVLGIQYAVEHWRRNMPRCMGALYWQLNDCWPVASWSSIDHQHRWKALHYAARRFFAPLMLSTVEDLPGRRIDVFLNNDGADPCSGLVRWTITTRDGDTVQSGENYATAPAGASALVFSVDAHDALEACTPRNLLAWFQFESRGTILSRSLALFARPKHITLPDPHLALRASVKGRRIRAELTARKPALWAWLCHPAADIRWDDNFFHLQAGETRVVQGLFQSEPAPDAADALQALSLYDTYRE